jgi:glycine/D-amino acid oxidase-like deaminating enzyme/nitrite reductase/ring-hydroxylating ferredoxin subunit
MQLTSLWMERNPAPVAYPSLNGTIEVDTAIIGAGITGITTARELVRAGQRVAIVESYRVGSGTTGYSTGNLYVPIQSHYRSMKKNFGIEMVMKVANARRNAIDYIEQAVQTHGIDCSFFRRPWYYYTNIEDDVYKVREEVETLRQAGFDINYVTDMPLPVPFVAAACMENQARFDPLRYVQALAQVLTAGGMCQIYEQTDMLDIDEKDDRCVLHTSGGDIICRDVVMATHMAKGFNLVQTVAAAYRSYAVGVRLREGVRYPNGNYWDTSSPHHATSTHSVHGDELDLLVVAGHHHKVGHSNGTHVQHYLALEQYIRSHYDVESVEFQWSAQHYQPADGRPYIGHAKPVRRHVYMATGYAADGLVYGTVAGAQITAMILGQETPLYEAFDATRFTPMASAKEFVKENLDVAMQYLKALPLTKKSDEFASIPPGEGRVIEVQGHKLGVYRDERSELHVVSAVCTHLKCIVEWNDAEKSWDCPCHGSRFRIDGGVIEGPAITPLEQKAW